MTTHLSTSQESWLLRHWDKCCYRCWIVLCLLQLKFWCWNPSMTSHLNPTRLKSDCRGSDMGTCSQLDVERMASWETVRGVQTIFKLALSTHKGCLLWGHHVIIPERDGWVILATLHTTHPGIGCMKTLASSYVCWPGIDDDIGKIVNEHSTCLVTRHNPPKAPTSPGKWLRKHS